jgi:hypothetical protein
MSLAWITASYGGHDTYALSIKQEEPHERIFVTDKWNASLRSTDRHTSPTPDFVRVEPRPHMHPRLAAKIPKCMPWLYTDADVVVWTDASIEVTSPDFLSFMLHNRQQGCCLSQFKHPHRDDVLDEAELSITMEKYSGQMIMMQAISYLKEDFPNHWGMWATGWGVWDLSTPKLRAEAEVLGEAWLIEQNRWSYQDQVSQPYVSWKHGIPIGTIPGDIFNPPHCTLRPHTRNT